MGGQLEDMDVNGQETVVFTVPDIGSLGQHSNQRVCRRNAIDTYNSHTLWSHLPPQMLKLRLGSLKLLNLMLMHF